MKSYSVIALMALLAGCATTEVGKPFDAATAANFVEGSSTRADVEGKLGAPSSITTNSNGESMLIYQHIVGKGNGFTGKAQAVGTTAMYIFGADGRLKQKTISNTDSAAR